MCMHIHVYIYIYIYIYVYVYVYIYIYTYYSRVACGVPPDIPPWWPPLTGFNHLRLGSPCGCSVPRGLWALRWQSKLPELALRMYIVYVELVICMYVCICM